VNSSRRAYLFDLDETLISSRSAIVEAYAEIGVIMPDDAWGKPWAEWLPQVCGDTRTAEKIHKMKTMKYAAKIDTLRILPPGLCARRLISRAQSVGVLTAASRDSTYAIMNHILPGVSWISGLSWQMKREVLEKHGGPGYYIDDNEEQGRAITKDLDWTFVHYSGQKSEQLWELLWKSE
jgi:beta-phosphoglucomutase-like phosphatase (HAD superfamily)